MSLVAEQIAEQIEGFLVRRKVSLDLSQEQLARQIQQYMTLRCQGAHPFSIQGPAREVTKPEGWSIHAEQVWQDWISNTIHVSDWLREVFRPVFGGNTCRWDSMCEGWREELCGFVPQWAQRTFTIVNAYDATPYDTDEEDDPDPRSAKVDPYLMDHAPRSKQTKSSS